MSAAGGLGVLRGEGAAHATPHARARQRAAKWGLVWSPLLLALEPPWRHLSLDVLEMPVPLEKRRRARLVPPHPPTHTHTLSSARVWHEPGGATWEPFFTPRPGGRGEDDGVVLSTVMQPDGRSALLVLDARSWQEVARAVLPYALPNGFHGCFVPS